MEVVYVFLAIAGVVVGLFVLGVGISLLGRKCPNCGSRKTFTWTCTTPDASHGYSVTHTNVNRYCFKCCDFTLRDDFGWAFGDLNYRLTYLWAKRHHEKHYKQDPPPEAVAKSSSVTTNGK